MAVETFTVEFGEFLDTETDFDAALEHLKRSISAIVREDRQVTRYYIGKASGTSAVAAIYRRYDDKKTANALTEDWALYESPSAHSVAALEDALNDYFMKKHPHRCCNTGKGSAGRPSQQPKHYIYLCLARD